MDTKPMPTTGQRSLEDFAPPFEWAGDDQSEILLLDLRGFRKEHLKVQMDDNRNLRISGERPLGGNRWSRFRKDFHIKETLNVSEIRAKFESEVLYVILPKLITRAQAPPAPNEKAKPSGAEQEATRKADAKAGGKPEAPRAQAPPVNEKAKTGGTEQEATQKAQAPPASEKARPGGAQQEATQKAGAKAGGAAETVSRRQDNGKAATETKPGGAQQETTSLQKAGSETEAIGKKQENGQEKERDRAKEPVDTGKDSGGASLDSGKKEVVAEGKVASGGGATATGKGPAWNEGGGLAVRLRPRQLLLNVAVAIMVLGSLGMYFYWQVTKATSADSE